jgi:hypothetical protein
MNIIIIKKNSLSSLLPPLTSLSHLSFTLSHHQTSSKLKILDQITPPNGSNQPNQRFVVLKKFVLKPNPEIQSHQIKPNLEISKNDHFGSNQNDRSA